MHTKPPDNVKNTQMPDEYQKEETLGCLVRLTKSQTLTVARLDAAPIIASTGFDYWMA